MESIIFDLDGTLWDSRQVVAESWTRTLKNSKYPEIEVTKADLTRVMGLQMDEIGEILFADVPVDERTALIDRCGREENEYILQHGGILYTKLEETLAYLQEKYRLFIVSNCQAGYIESFWAHHGLGEYFIDSENPGVTGLSKGENIKLVMERNEIEATVYIGDTLGDQEAAAFAGIPFVYATYGFGEVTDFHYKITAINEMKEIF